MSCHIICLVFVTLVMLRCEAAFAEATERKVSEYGRLAYQFLGRERKRNGKVGHDRRKENGFFL